MIESTLNRHARRTEVAEKRLSPQRTKTYQATVTREARRKAKQASIEKKHAAVHERAVARKELAKGIQPSITKRIKKRIGEIQKNREIKKQRQARYLKKSAK